MGSKRFLLIKGSVTVSSGFPQPKLQYSNPLDSQSKQPTPPSQHKSRNPITRQAEHLKRLCLARQNPLRVQRCMCDRPDHKNMCYTKHNIYSIVYRTQPYAIYSLVSINLSIYLYICAYTYTYIYICVCVHTCIIYFPTRTLEGNSRLHRERNFRQNDATVGNDMCKSHVFRIPQPPEFFCCEEWL